MRTALRAEGHRNYNPPTELTDVHGYVLFKQKYGIIDAYKNN
jgi:hypothetical protein